MSYDESAAKKGEWLAGMMPGWKSKLRNLESPDPASRLGYRNRVLLATEFMSGNWRAGFRQGDELISIDDCPLHEPGINTLLAMLLPSLPPPSEWPMAYIAVYGRQLTFVLKDSRIPDLSWFHSGILSQYAGQFNELADGVWLHLHPSAGNRVFLKFRWEHVYGLKYSTDSSGLAYGPVTFRQNIRDMHIRSIDLAERFLSPGVGDLVLDLYCGSGGTLRTWLGRGADAIGVELGGEAVTFAGMNAPAARVFRGKCSERIPQLREQVAEFSCHSAGKGRILGYLNPPRTGLELEVLQWLAMECNPPKIAYLSCSAGTLRRDLMKFEDFGYSVCGLTPFDFFPYTHHVEVLACLER